MCSAADYNEFSQVTPNIYVGGHYPPIGKSRLEDLGIEFSINLREEYDDVGNGLALVNHCHLPVRDGDAPSQNQLADGIRFMRMAINEGGKVYVHCAGGIGRSPTMVAAYLISEGYSVDQAVALIKAARSFIRLEESQLAQLHLLSKQLGETKDR